MSTTSTSSAAAAGSDLRAELVHLMHGCPVDQCNPGECPMFQLRQLDDYPRLQWIKSLDQADLEFLLAYHYICMGVKLAALHAAHANP